jgi:hypothetical protein
VIHGPAGVLPGWEMAVLFTVSPVFVFQLVRPSVPAVTNSYTAGTPRRIVLRRDFRTVPATGPHEEREQFTLSQLAEPVGRAAPGTRRTAIPGDNLGGVPKTEDAQDPTLCPENAPAGGR